MRCATESSADWGLGTQPGLCQTKLRQYCPQPQVLHPCNHYRCIDRHICAEGIPRQVYHRHPAIFHEESGCTTTTKRDGGGVAITTEGRKGATTATRGCSINIIAYGQRYFLHCMQKKRFMNESTNKKGKSTVLM